MSQVYEFAFTGSPEEFQLNSGVYLFELWGAGGQSRDGTTTFGGKGGYTKAVMIINGTKQFSVRVGGFNSYNGGGIGGKSHTGYQGAHGGGATDIRIGEGMLEDRILVAGGGGGSTSLGSVYGGSGGGESGGDGIINGNVVAKGGTQTEGYALGQGQNGANGSQQSYTVYYYTPGAGGGYYGGYAMASGTGNSFVAGGGSGYISNDHFVLGTMENGIQIGDGAAKVTKLSELGFDMNLNVNVIQLSKNTELPILNIKIYINENLVNSIDNPENAISYIIQDSESTFGVNYIKIENTIQINENDTVVTNQFLKYIKYGGYMPSNLDLTTIVQYLQVMDDHLGDLRDNLQYILSNQGFNVSNITRLSDLINLVDTMVNSNNAETNELLSQIMMLQTELNDSRMNLINLLLSKGVSVDTNTNFEDALTLIEGWGNISPQHLYNVGDEYTDVTGGWVECNKYAGNYVTVTSEKQANCLYLYSTVRFSFTGSIGFVMNDTIDFTDFVRISIDKTINMQSAGSVNLQILNESGTVVSSHTLLQNISNVNGSHNALFELDIRHLTGPHKLKVIINNPGNNGGSATIIIDVKINRITLDRK